jgi:hypothetical protein
MDSYTAREFVGGLLQDTGKSVYISNGMIL